MRRRSQWDYLSVDPTKRQKKDAALFSIMSNKRSFEPILILSFVAPTHTHTNNCRPIGHLHSPANREKYKVARNSTLHYTNLRSGGADLFHELLTFGRVDFFQLTTFSIWFFSFFIRFFGKPILNKSDMSQSSKKLSSHPFGTHSQLKKNQIRSRERRERDEVNRKICSKRKWRVVWERSEGDEIVERRGRTAVRAYLNWEMNSIESDRREKQTMERKRNRK